MWLCNRQIKQDLRFKNTHPLICDIEIGKSNRIYLLKIPKMWCLLKGRWETISTISSISQRSLRNRWDRWTIVERLLRVLWEIASLSDHWAIVLDQVKTLRRPWRPWRSLRDHWEIIKRSGRLLGVLWKIVERSGHIFIAQRSLNDRHPWVKGV